jgi:hypothetical protein
MCKRRHFTAGVRPATFPQRYQTNDMMGRHGILDHQLVSAASADIVGDNQEMCVPSKTTNGV